MLLELVFMILGRFDKLYLYRVIDRLIILLLMTNIFESTNLNHGPFILITQS